MNWMYHQWHDLIVNHFLSILLAVSYFRCQKCSLRVILVALGFFIWVPHISIIVMNSLIYNVFHILWILVLIVVLLIMRAENITLTKGPLAGPSTT